MTLDEALCDVKIAFLQIEFAVKLHSFCELKKVDLSEFDTDEIILLEHGNLYFPAGNFGSREDVVRAAGVSVALAFGASALALDKAWEIAGVVPNFDSEDKNVKLRTLVYMIRCAFAHGVADPRWKVAEKFRRKIEISLPNCSISLDLRALHGKRFEFSALGGHDRWYEVHDATVATLTANNTADSTD